MGHAILILSVKRDLGYIILSGKHLLVVKIVMTSETWGKLLVRRHIVPGSLCFTGCRFLEGTDIQDRLEELSVGMSRCMFADFLG